MNALYSEKQELRKSIQSINQSIISQSGNLLLLIFMRLNFHDFKKIAKLKACEMYFFRTLTMQNLIPCSIHVILYSIRMVSLYNHLTRREGKRYIANEWEKAGVAVILKGVSFLPPEDQETENDYQLYAQKDVMNSV